MRVYYKNVQLNPTQETDYTDLINKPSLNGVELEGDLSTEQIKVTWYGTQAEFDALPSHDPYTFYIIDDGTPVGTQDSYLDLADKPSINGQVLTGNKLPSDLDMYSRPDVDNLLASMRSIKVVATKPAAPAANTMYYVGPDSESNYHVYLYDALLNEIDLGMAMNQLYREGTAIDIDSANTINVKIDDDTIKTNSNNKLYVKKLDTTLTKGANTANAVKAVWVENGDVKEHTVDSGTNVRPVFIDGGTIKPVNQAASGNYKNFVPYTASNGITELGNTVDFHDDTDTTDFNSRLCTGGASGNTGWGIAAGDLYVRNGVDANRSGTVITSGTVNKAPVPLKTLTALNATQIASNANLNTATYCTVGNYVSGANSSVAAYTNCPTSSAFRLTVESLRASKVDASDFANWTYLRRTIEDIDNRTWVQLVNTDGSGNLQYGAWRRVLAGDITASGNRHNVFPYTSGANTAVGKFVDFYVENADTSATSQLWAPNAAYAGTQVGDLRVENKTTTSRSGTVLTSGIVKLKNINTITSLNGFVPTNTMSCLEDDRFYYINIWGGTTTADIHGSTHILELPMACNGGGMILGLTDNQNIPMAVQVWNSTNTKVTTQSGSNVKFPAGTIIYGQLVLHKSGT